MCAAGKAPPAAAAGLSARLHNPRLVTIRTVSAPFRSYVLVSREQIARNFRNVRSVVGPHVEVAGVVKADAYGHGALEVARVLCGEGARWLAVSSVDEGVQLRSGGIHDARILVMGGFLPYEADAVVEFDLTPAVHSLAQIRDVDRLAAASGKPIRYHLKIDSGMGRLGTRASARGNPGHTRRHASRPPRRSDDPLRLCRGLHFVPDRDPVGLLPRHLRRPCKPPASARRICTPPAPTPSATAAPRAGTPWCAPDTRSTATSRRRAATLPPQLLNVKPALTWKAKLLAVKEIPEGALVGYGGSFRAPRPMRIGILGAGYADGMFHRLSNRGKVIADGKLTPILGTVSMDLTTIDLSHTTALAAGDEVTLLGTEGECSVDAQQTRQSGRDHFLQHPLQHQRPRAASVV